MWTVQGWYDAARASAEKQKKWYHDMAEYRLPLYSEALPGMSREAIGKMLADHNKKRLDAVPSLAKYPELRGMREMIAAEWKGTQDGAGLDDVQAAIMADGAYYYHRNIAGGRHKQQARCSVVYFPTSDEGALIAANLDTGIHEPYGEPTWPAINEHLVAGGVSSGVFLDEESPEIFPAPVWKIVARYARSSDDAVEIMSRYNHFWGPCNTLIADRSHDVAMIEKTACRISVRRSADGFGYVTAMTQEDPAMWDYVNERRLASLKDRGLPNPCADTRYWAAQDTRRKIMNRLMDEARKKPTLDKLRSIMQYRGKDGLVAGNGDVLFPGDAPIEHTIRTAIVCLSKGKAVWWARDNERNIPSWENRMPDVKLSDVPLWD